MKGKQFWIVITILFFTVGSIFTAVSIASEKIRIIRDDSLRPQTTDSSGEDTSQDPADENGNVDADEESVYVEDLEPVIEKLPNGYVDWTHGEYFAYARGYTNDKGAQARASAKRAAEVVALREILQMASNIRLDSNNTIGSFKKGTLVIELQGKIKNFEIVDGRWFPESERPYYEITVKAPMYGVTGLFSAVYGSAVDDFLESHKKERYVVEPEGYPSDEEYDSIIIDARGLDVSPALCPVITSQDGKRILDITKVKQKSAVNNGMVRYATTEQEFDNLSSFEPSEFSLSRESASSFCLTVYEDVLDPPVLLASGEAVEENDNNNSDTTPQRPRFARKRFVVQAQEVEGEQSTDIVLNEEDAGKLREVGNTANLLSEGKVIIIVDSSTAGIEGVLPLEYYLASLEQ